MSRIINRVKKHKKAAVVLSLMLVIIAILLVFRMYIPAIIIIAFAVVDELTVRKMNKQKAPFGTYSKIRNADCLVIGDIPQKSAQALPVSGTAISIYLPGCTLAGAYEVLRHTFSILKEDGGLVMLVVRKNNIDKAGYSPFEISFFHLITINRLELNNSKYMLRLPVLFAPIKSLMFLFGIKRGNPAGEYCNEEIENFCKERGIEVKILEV